MKKRYIILTEEEELFLKEQKKQSKNERERDRSQSLLLSNKGYTVNELSEIFEVRKGTILEWFNRWEQRGAKGLKDKEKSGRPRIFTKMEEKK